MSMATAKNSEPLSLAEIPVLTAEAFRESVAAACSGGARPAGLFKAAFPSGDRIVAVLADDGASLFRLFSAEAAGLSSYPSLTPEIPAFHLFERELWEETGILPEGHPWLKPVRYPRGRFDANNRIENYPFYKFEGEGVHEVGVGPVHAGIIEPGHFRFSCHGELVYHLEIQLGYQHRGVERMFETCHDHERTKAVLAESVAGDTVVGHCLAYCQAAEGLSGVRPTGRDYLLRGVALELERAAVHIGDLSALCNDVAYLLGNAVFGATRTLVINTSLAFCGNRFGRGFIRPGGVRADAGKNTVAKAVATLRKVAADVRLMGETMFGTPSVMERFEGTGRVSKETAVEIGLVGPAGRASGLDLDVRRDLPSGVYEHSRTVPVVKDTGDVAARAGVRYEECLASLATALDLLGRLDGGPGRTAALPAFRPSSIVVSATEGWRGEIVHAAVTDPAGRISRYKIKDPSFNNWFGLALAVRDNGISDFPLCNKSFNLSYAGFDL